MNPTHKNQKLNKSFESGLNFQFVFGGVFYPAALSNSSGVKHFKFILQMAWEQGHGWKAMVVVQFLDVNA